MPYFFISNSEKGWYSVQFFKKMFKLRIFERYVECSFDNHACSFSLKVQKNVAQNGEKKQNSNFFLSK